MKRGNPNKRPTFNGFPLPWIARMDTERPYVAENLKMARVADGEWVGEWVIADMDPPHYRDSRSIWWMAYTPPSGGKPEFAALTPDRHRRCFDERRCQVCGLIIRHPLTWVIEQRNLGRPTAHAPLHRRCVDTALKLCPHWARTPFVVLESDEWEVVGVYGDVLTVRMGEPTFTETATIKLDDPRIMRTMAKQLVVNIVNYKEVMRRGANGG